MWFNNKAAAVLGGAAMITGLLVAPAAADAATCETSVAVRLASPGKWSYSYHVTWCVVDGVIDPVSITPHLAHAADGTTCAWAASAEEAHLRVNDGRGAWQAFNMGEFRCRTGDGTDGSINPWGVIEILPDGTSSVVRKGVGDLVID
ncbi:hypothetical protein SAMN05216553_101201 [Lentzea fradiae]|uniref:Uncharacterized protein n=1 Tax=Lentzea fradiae TaxID=200378 RepID=A0A1G7KCV7_9PSEU|nr:hypothetical protein [Lentzea fradiae]SDF34804.1 hypothetical protein SAMN05216553_101201 [Lentzea fradiae]